MVGIGRFGRPLPNPSRLAGEGMGAERSVGVPVGRTNRVPDTVGRSHIRVVADSQLFVLSGSLPLRGGGGLGRGQIAREGADEAR